MRSKQKKWYIICIIKNVYIFYNYSINCWGHIDPKDYKCKQEMKRVRGLKYKRKMTQLKIKAIYIYIYIYMYVCMYVYIYIYNN